MQPHEQHDPAAKAGPAGQASDVAITRDRDPSRPHHHAPAGSAIVLGPGTRVMRGMPFRCTTGGSTLR
jgi:hypothetical protein